MFVFLEGTYSGTAFLGDEDQEDATHRQASSADMANMAEFSGFVSSKMRATLQVFIDWFTT